MRIYIWSTNCFNKYRFKIWCKSMRYLVYSICSFHLKTRSITPSGNIVKNKWLIFTWFWRKATVYNLQCPNNFFHNIRYINTGVQCLLSCAVADDDLGVSKALICEAEFDSSFFFWGEKFTFPILQDVSFLFHDLLLQTDHLMRVQRFCDKRGSELLLQFNCFYVTSP